MIEKHKRSDVIYRVLANSVAKNNGCREWLGTKNNGGYGLIHAAWEDGDGYKSPIPVHRAMYMAHHDVILGRDEFVRQRCGSHSCVNIEHLFVFRSGGKSMELAA